MENRLKNEIIQRFYAGIGDAKDKLSAEDIELLTDVAKDAASLTFKALNGGEVEESEYKIINATLANISVAATLHVQRAFWLAVQNASAKVLGAVTQIILTAALTLI